MRLFIPLAGLLVIAAVVPADTADLVAESTATVGKNLQTDMRIRLGKAAPKDGLELTVTSDDPKRLLLATKAGDPGTPSISLKVAGGFVWSPEFSLRGVGTPGTVSYTVSSPGLENGKGTVTLVNSAIVILGPHREPKFSTTPRGAQGQVTVVSVALNDAGKILAEQPVASGLEVQITSSQPGVAKLRESKLKIEAGFSTAATYFDPAGEQGETTIAAVQPADFKVPAERASFVVKTSTPGFNIGGDYYIGKDLQSGASLLLGEPAPPEGVTVTLRSADPSKLVLSENGDTLGTGELKLKIPGGGQGHGFVLQALADSGIVEYYGTAPGYKDQVSRIGLAASGIIMAYEPYGPPEEGNVTRKIGGETNRAFFASVSQAKKEPVRMVLFSAYLDHDNGRGADRTVQTLRAGVSATIHLSSSDPEVATIQSPVTIAPGTFSAVVELKPLKPGKTILSLDTPPGFTTPKNAVDIPATISQ
jgi:hypothetical protein